MIMDIYIDEPTLKRLQKLRDEGTLSTQELCENAMSEAALNAFRHRNDDPGSETV